MKTHFQDPRCRVSGPYFRVAGLGSQIPYLEYRVPPMRLIAHLGPWIPPTAPRLGSHFFGYRHLFFYASWTNICRIILIQNQKQFSNSRLKTLSKDLILIYDENNLIARFLYKSSAFSRIELQMLLRCCLIHISSIKLWHFLCLLYLGLGLFMSYLCDLFFIFILIFIPVWNPCITAFDTQGPGN